MNKNLIAIAITAALAVPSIAAAEVKIIGQAQLELVSTSGTGVTEGLTIDDSGRSAQMGKSNASAIGVTGSHDLGNGMTGLYKVNFNFHSDDNGEGLSKGRDTFVGLKGDFGTVLVGRMNSPYKTSTVKWDPFLATFLQGRVNNGMSNLHDSYVNNAIAYANKFGSAKFVAALLVDESDNNVAGGDGELDGDIGFNASLNIPLAESLELAVAFHSNPDEAGGTAVKVGVKWKSGDLTIAGQFETLDEDLSFGPEGQGDQSNVYANIQMALGEGASVALAFGSQTDESDAATPVDGTYTSLGYKKALSKKVSWHAGVVIVDEGVLGLDNDATQIGAGMRVKF